MRSPFHYNRIDFEYCSSFYHIVASRASVRVVYTALSPEHALRLIHKSSGYNPSMCDTSDGAHYYTFTLSNPFESDAHPKRLRRV